MAVNPKSIANLIPNVPHEKTEENSTKVETLAAVGVNQEQIAAFIGLAVPALCKYYRAELDDGKAKGQVKVSQFLFNAASGKAMSEGASYGDCLRAAMFYAKTQMGWRETQTVEVSNPDGSLKPSTIILTAAQFNVNKKENDDDADD